MPAGKKNIYRLIANIFICLTLIVIGAIVHLTLATATITLPQKTDPFVFDGPIAISKTTAEDNIYGEIVSTELSDTATQPVSQKITKGDKAVVTITIINETANNQPLVATTRFLSADQKLFRLNTAVTVPARGEVSAIITADEPGDEYLVSAGRFTIPGLWPGLQDKIYGSSEVDATFDQPSDQVLTQADIDSATANLMEAMLPKALKSLQEKLPGEVSLTEDHIAGTVLNQTVSAEVGDKVNSIKIDITARFDAMVFDRDLLLATAKEKLKEQLPDNVSVVTFKDDSFSYQLQEINSEAQTAKATIHLEALVTTGAIIQGFIEPRTLRGKSVQEAENYLNEQGLPGAQVTLWPFWVTRIPVLEDHIIIKSQ